jgi:hypothetical protein
MGFQLMRSPPIMSSQVSEAALVTIRVMENEGDATA